MNIWITSDSHYGHQNIVGSTISKWDSGYRNFTSLQEMNETLIKNINDKVKENDILYHLGDWSFGGIDNLYYFRKSLICKNIHLLLGNHDHLIVNKDKKLSDGTIINPYDLFTSVNHVFTGKIGKQYFHLSHYSHQIWPKSHHGSIHLFGHSHGTATPIGKSMDVGIDTHKEFRPYHINEIITLVDHHGR